MKRDVRPFTYPPDHELAGLRGYLPILTTRRRRSPWWWVVGVVGLLLGLSVRAKAEACIESIELVPKAAAVQQLRGRYTYAVRVRVRQHPEHRLLVLTWDGGAVGGGQSRRALEGDDAAITWTFRLRDQPAGRYVFVATVFDDRGRPVGRVRTETLLVGDDGDS